MNPFLGSFMTGLKANAPKILIGAGIIGGVVTVVTACVATTKAGDILDKHNAEMEKIEKAKKVAKPEDYTEEDIRHDRLIVWGYTIRDMAKLYWKPAVIGAGSIVCVLGGYKIISARYGAAAAALSVTQSMFSKYRSNVVKDVGVEKDREYLYSSRIEKGIIEEEVTNPETGKVKKVKRDAEFIDIDVDMQTGSIRVFAEYNPSGKKNTEWDPDIDINLYTLRAKQQIWNDAFRSRGFVFLNDVAVDLGLDATQAGQVLGWKYEEGKYIDFGLGDYSDPQIRRYINGSSDCLILHFNIDGEYDSNQNLISAEPIIDALEA